MSSYEILQKLFERHNVAEHNIRQSISNILGCSYSTAHRRYRPDRAWTVEEITQIANHFGEDYSGKENELRTAELIIGNEKFPVKVAIGRSTAPQKNKFFAIEFGERLTVHTWAEVTNIEHSNLLEVLFMEYDSTLDKKPRIAVLDDETEISQIAAEILTSKYGMDADAFFDPDKVFRHAALYDAFVLDWLIGDFSCEGLINSINKNWPEKPIIILSGETNSEHQASIALAMQKYSCIVLPKPIPFGIIAETIKIRLMDKN